jgi:hypothetical protein
MTATPAIEMTATPAIEMDLGSAGLGVRSNLNFSAIAPADRQTESGDDEPPTDRGGGGVGRSGDPEILRNGGPAFAPGSSDDPAGFGLAVEIIQMGGSYRCWLPSFAGGT